MPLRFAASRDPAQSPIARIFVRAPTTTSANDNLVSGCEADSGPGAIAADLADALRLFGRHGLGAARIAHDMADAATRSGEERERARWLGVCRCLDRRMAQRLETAV